MTYVKVFAAGALAWLLGVMCADASVLQVNGTPTSIKHASEADLIDVAAPNGQRVSINRFSRFEISGKPLSISNLSKNGNGEVADLIVIVADSILIESPVSILGPSADILFLSPSNGSVTCNACQFNNVYRVSLVSAKGEAGIGNGASALGAPIGVMEINGAGQVNVATLDAAGALAIDLVAPTVRVSGVLNTHQRATKTPAGSYQYNLNGPYTIGAGAINVIGSASYWDYDAQRVNGFIEGAAALSQIAGTINTTALKVFASDNLSWTGQVKTNTSLNAAVRYRGNTRITEEQVSVTSVSGNIVNVSAHVTSDGSININSGADLTVKSGVNVSGQNVTFIARGSLNNYANLKADVMQAAADTIRNEGSMDASHSLDLWASKSIINRRGGAIRGKSLSLEAENGYILNGSRTPFKHESPSFIPYPADYTENLNPIKLGTFYVNGTESIAPLGSQATFSASSAHIAGANIKIKAAAFENINPYYIKVIPEEDTVLRRELLAQVSTIAESTLDIETTKYLVNSSAILGVQSDSGLMRLDSPKVINERYRVLSLMDDVKEVVSNSDEMLEFIVNTTTTEVYKTVVATYSPPGLMFSMGQLQIKAEQEFVNAVGYVEIFGDSEFATGKFADVGLEQGQVQKDLSVTAYQGLYCHYGCSYQSTSNVLGDPTEMDSLFYAGGNVRVKTSDSACHSNPSACFYNVNSFDSYLQMAISNIVAGNDKYKNESEYGDNDPLIWSERWFEVRGLDDTDANFQIAWSWDREVYFGSGAAKDSTIISTEGVDEFSIWQVMKDLYQTVKDWWTDLMAELDWWS